MNASLKKRLLDTNKSILIGVAGDSGAGKSTFTKGIISLLGKNLVSTFSTDDYHKEDREQREKSGILPLDPNANYLDLLTEHLEKLKNFESIDKPVYNHRTGKFDPATLFEPAPIIIVEGLHPFYTSKLKKLIDFKIFVDPSRKVKYVWKIKRDIEKRGIGSDRIFEEMMAREPLYRRYVDPQKLFADMVVEIQRTRFVINPMLELEEMASHKRNQYRVKLIQKILDYQINQTSISFDFQTLLQGGYRPFHMEFYNDVYFGRKVTTLVFDGEIQMKNMEPLLKRILEQIERKDTSSVPYRQKEYLDVVEISQLFICWRFIEMLNFILPN